MKTLPLGWLRLNRAEPDLINQLCCALRERILAGVLGSGARLPSTRTLAKACGVSRSTAVEAYGRLQAEGFLEATEGGSTRVAPFLEMPSPQRLASRPTNTTENATEALPFQPGSPGLDDFPHKIWTRCLAASGRSLTDKALDYHSNSNDRRLRQAICEHLSIRRGVNADVQQIVIMPSTSTILDVVARITAAMSGITASAWIEEPGYASAQVILPKAGFALSGVPCDNSGIAIAQATGSPPNLIYVTPSHQYPTGVTMTLTRRLELLRLAQNCNALIIEDDYDSEFQYDGSPIAALQSIDRGQCVAYLGTFSKVMAPGLRVAYAVLPHHLVDPVLAAQRERGLYVSAHIQTAMSDFIADGHLRAHIRTMNRIYKARMAMLKDALSRHGSGTFDVPNGGGGLQLAVWFSDRLIDDVLCAERLRIAGYGVQALSGFFIGRSRSGLLLGVGTIPENIDKSVKQLVKVVNDSRARG